MNWGTILRNIFSNWTGYVVTAAIGFLLAPFIVHSLGNTGYGLWTLVLSLTGYFGLLDLGIRSSVGRFVGRYLALNDHEKANSTISSAFTILASAGALALLVTAVVAKFFFHSFHVDPQLEAAAKTALLITGLNMSCVLPFGVFSAVLIALERYDIISGVTIAGELLRAVLVVAFLKHGYGLVAIAWIAFLISAAEYSGIGFFVIYLYRPFKLRWKLVNLPAIKDLFSFGIYRFIWIVSNQLIFYSDSVVIGIFLGAGAITYYAIAGSLINYGRNVVSLVTDTFGPVAFRMDAKEDLAGLQRLLILGTRIALLVGLPLCVGFLFLGRQFIVLWMGKEYVSSAVFLLVLTIPQFTSMPQYVSATVLAAMAKHRILAHFVLAEGLANLILSIILVRKIGLVGVAWGTVIPHLINTGLIIPLYTLHTLKLGVRQYLWKAYLWPGICAVPAALVCYAFSRLVEHVSWLVFGAEVMAVCGVFGIMSYFLCLNSGQRASAIGKLQSVLRLEPVNS